MLYKLQIATGCEPMLCLSQWAAMYNDTSVIEDDLFELVVVFMSIDDLLSDREILSKMETNEST